ncbi:hypothetical protein pdam_00002648, partial [Pocillopora damicornis]
MWVAKTRLLGLTADQKLSWVPQTSSSFFTKAIMPIFPTHCIKTSLNVAQMVTL